MLSRRVVLFSLALLAVLLGVQVAGDWMHAESRRAYLNRELIAALHSPPGQRMDTARVKALLAQGANPNARGEKGVLALSWAAEKGELDSVRALIDAGADPNCRGGWLPALNMAVSYNHVEVVRLLLDRGADPNNMREGDGSWALYLASSKRDRRMIALLKSYGARYPSREALSRNTR